MLYKGTVPFADVAKDNWFAHYAKYAYDQGLTESLQTIDAQGNIYLNPDALITRYEAIKIIMLSYYKIKNPSIDIQSASVLGDIIDPSNPYYKYIRQAEAL